MVREIHATDITLLYLQTAIEIGYETAPHGMIGNSITSAYAVTTTYVTVIVVETLWEIHFPDILII
jgi:hypothetical protein